MRLSLYVQVVTISCSSSIISKDTRKKNDGVIGCDEQGTTNTPPIGLDLGAVNIYCLLHDKMIYKMKNIDTYWLQGECSKSIRNHLTHFS